MTAAAEKTETQGQWQVETNYPRKPGWRVCVPERPGSSVLHTIVETDSEDHARLFAAAPDLLAELDVRTGDLVMLLKAIEAGDPKAELLIRVNDMLRETRAAIAKASSIA